MAEITAGLVKELREQTGAGMMECKKALQATAGDLAAAEDWLRKNGALKAAKKATRTAAEGLVGLAVAGGKGVVVEVNSETDFVARNEDFKSFVTAVAQQALTAGDSVDTLLASKLGDATVADSLTALVAKIGEHMTVRRVGTVEADVVASYVHNAAGHDLGKIGVLVALKSTADKEKLAALGKQIAMHVAAASPIALSPATIPAEVLEHEKAVQAEIVAKKAVGKPANIVEKMIEGSLRKFYEEVTLLEQVFVIDQQSKISAVLEKAGKDFGAPVEIAAFLRWQVGEGIAKKADDFADEVAKMAGN
jgi:elongation factor Ts